MNDACSTPDSEIPSVREAGLQRAIAVHAQIPEFEPTYVADNYAAKGIGGKHPYIIIGQVGQTDASYMIGYDTPGSMYIWLTGTLPARRRRGLLRMMVDNLSQEARARKHTKLTVKSYERYQPMLRALTAMGFERTATDGHSIWFAKNLDYGTPHAAMAQ